MDAKVDAWERTHREREWGIWPNEHFVRFVMRTYGAVPDRKRIRFLDIGCGAGAQTRFLASEGFSVTAVDRSDAAVERVAGWIQAGRVLTAHCDWLVADVEQVDFAHGMFDCLVDVCSLQHVREPLLVLGRATKWLKPGGRMFSVWASDAHDKATAEAISGHCWRLGDADIAAHFAVFPEVERQVAVYSDANVLISHWLVSARKKQG